MATFYLEALEENPLPCLFRLLETAYTPGLVTLFHLPSQELHHADPYLRCHVYFSDSSASLYLF